MDPNKSGLIFSGSAFSKRVWEKYPFREDVATFEDKEWTKRVLEKDYDIEFSPSIFHYEIKRTRKQQLFRFKNDMVGNYQLWHTDFTFENAFRGLMVSIYNLIKSFFVDFYYIIYRFIYLIKFVIKKPKKF